MERFGLSRLRWRMRGAWMWPTFIGFTVVDGLLFAELPFAGEGMGVLPGALLAGFLNLIAVAVLAPLAGRLLRRRRPDLPKVVADDRAGTALIVAIFALLLAGGLLHRPSVVESERDFERQAAAAKRWIAHHGSATARANLAFADSIQIDEDLYRTCVPDDEPDRAFCLYVKTDQDPPGIERDTSRATNVDYIGRGDGERGG